MAFIENFYETKMHLGTIVEGVVGAEGGAPHGNY